MSGPRLLQAIAVLLSRGGLAAGFQHNTSPMRPEHLQAVLGTFCRHPMMQVPFRDNTARPGTACSGKGFLAVPGRQTDM